MLPRHSRFAGVVALNDVETLRTGQHAPSGEGKEVLQALADGSAGIVIGTHALFQPSRVCTAYLLGA